MRIAFDGTALQPHRTGVGYYTEHLLHHVVEEATSDEVVVVSNGQIDTARALPARVQRHEAASPLPRQIWTQVQHLGCLSLSGVQTQGVCRDSIPTSYL